MKNYTMNYSKGSIIKSGVFVIVGLCLAVTLFAQSEWKPGYYNQGDTVKVTVKNSLFVARRSFNSGTVPSDNAYWNYLGVIPKKSGVTLEQLEARVKKLEDIFFGELPVDTPIEKPPVVVPPVEKPPVVVPPTVATGIRLDSGFATINAGSNIIFLKIPINAKPGDVLGIPVGHESGKGIPGTLGVGDSWPYLKFNKVADLKAATALDGTYATNFEDGRVYRNNQGTWELFEKWGYYLRKMVPIAYYATVVNVSGDGLTLEMSKKASASVKEAPIYFDNSIYLNKALDFRSTDSQDDVFVLPQGRIAVFNILVVRNSNGVKTEINGNGATLFSPAGAPCFSMQMLLSDYSVHDLNIEGNMTDEGYGLTWWDGNPDHASMVITENTRSHFYPFENRSGLHCIGARGEAYNVNIKNTMSPLITVENDSKAWNINTSVTSQHNQDGWQMLIIKAKGASIKNSTISAVKMSGGFEIALSEGAIFENIKTVNCINAVNSAGGFIIKNIEARYTQDSKSDWMNWGHPSLDINGYFTLINHHAKFSGGEISNYHITQEGYIETATKGTLRGIQLGEGVEDIRILNCSVTKPAGGDKASLFVENPSGVIVDGFIINGAVAKDDGGRMGGKYYADISVMGNGTGQLKNITGANYIWRSSGVTLENSICNIYCGVSN